METLRVLVVDDEMGIRAGVARALRNFAAMVPDLDLEVIFEVSQAETAEEGLARMREEPPDILLLDNKLPGMSGMEALDRIAPMNLDMHTIIITAYASIETAVRATKRGAYDFLPKPFTPAELRSAVDKATSHLLVTRHGRKLAAEKRKVRFQFVSVLAHELKAPLSAVEGYLRILRERSAGADPEVYEEMLRRCMLRTEYMRKMIADLLDLTRIESGQKARNIVELDLAEIAQTSIQTHQPQAIEQDITVELDHDGPVHLRGDRAEIEIVLNNLISNAIKYNVDGGRVDVRLARDDGQVTVEVADTGIGMTEAEAAKLFQEFVRIKNDKTKDILGSGLGLSTLKKLATLYRGNIRVQSAPNEGSTFRMVLHDASPEDTSLQAGDEALTTITAETPE